MGQKRNCLELADGTILEKGSCGYSSRNLWCWVIGKTMAECFQLFSNPEKIRTIRCYFFTEVITYTGFTELQVIQKSEDDIGEAQISICLTWPEGGEHSIVTEELNTKE